MICAALDTTHSPCLALSRNGDVILEQCLGTSGRESDRTLVPRLKQALQKAGTQADQVERWTVGTGPGSFSGVRVGIALVQGICAASSAECRGVPSSVALALAASAEQPQHPLIAVLNDARRGQLILSRYRLQQKALKPCGPARIADADDLTAEALGEQLLVTAQPAAVRKQLPDDCLARLLVRPYPETRFLLSPPGWPWPDSAAAATASLEPVYVRPAVFVPAHQPKPAPEN